MTPTPDQAHRSHAKTWLLQHAPPSALIEIYESVATANPEDFLNLHMIANVYFTLAGKEIDP